MADTGGMEFAATMRIYGLLGGDRSSFLYSGNFSDDHTARLIALVEALLSGSAVRKERINRLSFVAVEAYQNIIRHRAGGNGAPSRNARCMFLLSCLGADGRVLAINPVRKAETPALLVALSALEGLDRGQLKGLFLRGLQQQAIRARGGAGLGLIEMARRSDSGLRHDIVPLDEHNDLFLLNVTMGGPAEKGYRSGDAWELLDLIEHQHLLLAHAGRIGPTAQEVFMRMLEHEPEVDASTASRAYLAAVELLNRPDGGARSGMVAISRREGRLALTLLRSLTDTESEAAAESARQLSGLGALELGKRYRTALIAQASKEQDGDVPMLDLARHASGPLTWSAERQPGGTNLLTLRVPL